MARRVVELEEAAVCGDGRIEGIGYGRRPRDMPLVKEVGQDFSRRRIVGLKIFPLGKMLVRDVMIEVQDLAADEVGCLTDPS